ncbi:MAG: Gfo/Idh/MocA family oxidoreductase [Acidobacteria bacterium]|nr:Gfo/Idh/MocA family oxidoreductase [Acidobacteriota bacterium]
MSQISRRYFFYGSLLAGAIPAAGFGSVKSLSRLGYKSPNDKLNLAAIGAGGQPYSDLTDAAAGVENVVALADVDWARATPGFKKWPNATRYKDFRQMLSKQGREIDAVVIGTPDHMHATCALACMELGKHVYVEKPLTRTAWEARLLARAAEKYKVATQMGNQGYSHDATRVACEIFWSGEIGEVKEVHAWHGKPGWPQNMPKVPAPTAIPDTLDWDLWLGGAARREFTAGDEDYRSFCKTSGGPNGSFGSDPHFGCYLPFSWRGFFDFGSGLFGDWGVHILGPANWALQLGPESLISVEAVKKEGTGPFTYPLRNSVKYEFGARGSMPPVTVHWSDSNAGPAFTPPGMTPEEARKIPNTGPQIGPVGNRGGGYNLIFAGSKGYMGTSGRGEGVGLLPGTRWAEYKLPAPYLQRSPGANLDGNHAAHCRDWVRASKGGAPACSNFSIAAPYTEWLVLGAVASHYEGKLLWNNEKMEFSNNKDATKWIKPVFRKGWNIKL